MAAKTKFSKEEFKEIFANYDIGEFKGVKPLAHGGAQTTELILTTKGKFIFKYYENRTERYVLFELRLFRYLQNKGYPIPAVIRNSSGAFLSKYRGKPYVIIEYVDGEHAKNPNNSFNTKDLIKIIKAVTELHNFTQGYSSPYIKDHEELNAAYCWREYKKSSRKTKVKEREVWLSHELEKLEFPQSLPKGICHADLNHSNFLFRNGKVVAILDFDISFYTYLVYDIASLIYWWAWPPKKGFQAERAKFIVQEYSKYRKLSVREKNHIYDALKLIILLGISWSQEDDFENEKVKIEFLNTVGRKEFYHKILSKIITFY